MPEPSTETGKVVHELIDELHRLAPELMEGERAVADDQSVLEGYKWIFSILHVGLLAHVWADPANPRFVDIVGPALKWGGDNADAFYTYAPIDPARRYRVRARRGDTVYLSLTVYGGPRDGRYSTRIVGTANDRDLTPGPDGEFDLILSADEPDGLADWVNWMKLDDDAVCAITRDYLEHPASGRRAEWTIEALDPPPTYRETDADLARRFRAALTWLRDQAAIAPIPLGEPNTVDEPYPVPQETFGWAAGDAAYAMGSFDLGDDEALVVRGRSPECGFWNLCLWNQYLHTFNYDYERVTINGAQTVHEPDGSWTLVVAGRDPGHPNWVSTQGHQRGRIWFRWFLPVETPARPSTEVVSIDDVPPAPRDARPA